MDNMEDQQPCKDTTQNKSQKPYDRTSDADSDVYSLDSMLERPGFQGHMSVSDSAVGSEDTMPRGIRFDAAQHQSKPVKRRPDTESCVEDDSYHFETKRPSVKCDVCLGNVNEGVKYCRTCKVSYCETHIKDHYKVEQFYTHELSEVIQLKSRIPQETERLLQFSGSGLSWMLILILGALLSFMAVRFYDSSCSEELPELKLMLVGKIGAGKSASGNTILGREAFKSEASALPVTRHWQSQSGDVESRKITVIDTPGVTSEENALLSQSDKGKLGPHMFLLVVPLCRFTEEDSNTVKWIQNNFGDVALKFTIILFTGGDQLKGKPIDEYLHESFGHQSLLDNVGGRYHVFNNSFPKARNQVKGLIKKIDDTLMKNMGYAYTYTPSEHAKVNTAVRQEDERKREKTEKAMNQKEQNKTRISDPIDLPELRVMLLGKTGSGKSASGNTILGREAFKSEASALPVTRHCESQRGVVEGRNIIVIDTPGITSREVSWLSEKEKVALRPHVFLLVVQLGGFTEEDSSEVTWIKVNFGEEALKFTIVLFTRGDQLDQKPVEHFLRVSSELQFLVNSTGGGYHVFNNINPKGRTEVTGLLDKMEVLLRNNMGYSYYHGLHEKMKRETIPALCLSYLNIQYLVIVCMIEISVVIAVLCFCTVMSSWR